MLQKLNWEDHKSGREQNKVAMMYWIVNNLVEIPACQYLTAAGESARVINNNFWYRIVPPTHIRDPLSHLQSVSGIVYLPEQYRVTDEALLAEIT